MANRVSVTQATLNAIALWLRTQMPDVTVQSRWPETSQLPAKAITILQAGMPEYMLSNAPPELVSDDTSTLSTYRYRIWDVELPIQMDIWATSDIARDDLMARVDDIMVQGTLPIDPTASPTGGELVLNLGDGWTGVVGILSEGGRIINNPGAVKEREFRAMYQASAHFTLFSTKQYTKLKQIIFREKLDNAALFHIATITDTGATYSDGT